MDMKIKNILFCFGIILCASTAEAVTLVGTTVGSYGGGSTLRGDPAQFAYNNADIGGISSASWNTIHTLPGIPQLPSRTSSMSFDGIGSDGVEDWSATIGQAFLIGNYSFTNGEDDATSGAYQVNLNLDTNAYLATRLGAVGGEGNPTLTFDVIQTADIEGDHGTNTDTVSLHSVPRTFLFSYLNVNYYLEIIGLSADSGRNFSNNLSALEGRTANAGLYGRITTSVVPEPTTLILFGSGLLGMITKKRNFAKK